VAGRYGCESKKRKGEREEMMGAERIREKRAEVIEEEERARVTRRMTSFSQTAADPPPLIFVCIN
jgi:hypothetical protein